MKNIINDKIIEDTLKSFKPNDSVSLSLTEKQNILNSVFDRVEVPVVNVKHQAVQSPFYTYFTQYLKYSMPVILIVFIGTQAAGVFTDRSRIALSDINEVKSNLEELKRNNEIKSNLSKNQADIKEIKLNLASADVAEKDVKTQILASQLSSRSREIRNQVAALVSEDKITEAKKIALDLESALKADELYKVSTSVEAEVFSAMDLRLDIERKEKYSISTSTEKEVVERIIAAKKDILDFDKNASTTDIILEAEKSIVVSEDHLNAGDIENAIISLQSYDRIVADLRVILLP
jgi:hypothetical protein